MLNDADLELAVKAAVAGRYQNTDRFVQRQNALLSKRELLRHLPNVLWQLRQPCKTGDPRDEENARTNGCFDLRDELHHQVEKTLAQVRVCYWAAEDAGR